MTKRAAEFDLAAVMEEIHSHCNPFDSLPEDTLKTIFDHWDDFEDLWKMRIVCKPWFHFFTHSILYGVRFWREKEKRLQRISSFICRLHFNGEFKARKAGIKDGAFLRCRKEREEEERIDKECEISPPMDIIPGMVLRLVHYHRIANDKCCICGSVHVGSAHIRRLFGILDPKVKIEVYDAYDAEYKKNSYLCPASSEKMEKSPHDVATQGMIVDHDAQRKILAFHIVHCMSCLEKVTEGNFREFQIFYNTWRRHDLHAFPLCKKCATYHENRLENTTLISTRGELCNKKLMDVRVNDLECYQGKHQQHQYFVSYCKNCSAGDFKFFDRQIGNWNYYNSTKRVRVWNKPRVISAHEAKNFEDESCPLSQYLNGLIKSHHLAISTMTLKKEISQNCVMKNHHDNSNNNNSSNGNNTNNNNNK